MITINAGRTVTLQCFHDAKQQFLLWYKQSLGQEPRLVSSFYAQTLIFQPDFDKERRFSVDTEGTNNHLTIENMQVSDSATYFCASKSVNKFTFGNGTIVDVRGSGRNNTALVYKLSSGNVDHEESMSCKVQTGSCGGEYSVHWFQGSGPTHPGLVYTQGGGSEQCGRSRDTANTQPHVCAYNVKSPGFSQVNCAVAACGQVLFKKSSEQKSECEY